MINSYKTIVKASTAFLIIIYFSLVYYFTVNIPIVDDFSAIQNFLLKFVQSSSLKEKLDLLFSQFGEHRIVFARLIILLVYALGGGLSYSLFILIGNLLMLCICFFIYRTATNKDFSSIYLLLMISIFFNGQNFETSTWAMVSIANVGVLFVAMASMYCMLNTNNYKLQYYGLILSMLTIFSNGNGMFIVPPIAIGLYLQNRKKILFPFLCITIVTILLYFYDFNKSSRINIEFIDLIKNIPLLLNNFFIFVGLNFWIPSYKIISFLVGLSCVSVYLFGIWKKWHKSNILIYAFLTFYYLSAATVAVLWFSSEIEGALRYRIYCSPIIVLTLFLILNNIKQNKPKIIYTLSLLSILFSLSSTYIYALKEQKKIEWKKKSAYNWHNKRTGLATFSPFIEDESLQEVEKLGWYSMPKYPLSEYASSVLKDKVNTFNDAESISYKIEDITDNVNYLLIEGWGFLDNRSMNFKKIFVRLINQDQSYIVSTFAERRYDLDFDVPLDRIENCGFFAVIDKNLIPAGTYQVAISIKNIFGYGSYRDKITGESVIIRSKDFE